ncbi:MAG: hypothetical protein P8Z71_02980 [Candidatus Sulfobium sp.]|jgi:acyl-CoA hydrolase
MHFSESLAGIEELKRTYPEKFLPEESAFSSIHAGDRIFIGTGCGEPYELKMSLQER